MPDWEIFFLNMAGENISIRKQIMKPLYCSAIYAVVAQ